MKNEKVARSFICTPAMSKTVVNPAAAYSNAWLATRTVCMRFELVLCLTLFLLGVVWVIHAYENESSILHM